MKKLFILIFLVSCSISKDNYEKKKEILTFDKNLSFVEFYELANEYSEINPYPNIDR